MKMGIAAIFMIIGVCGSLILMTRPFLNLMANLPVVSADGTELVTGIALGGLLLMFFGDVIESFDFWKLKVKMRKVEESKKELEELAYLTVQMAVSAHQGSVILGEDDSASLEFRKAAAAVLRKAGVPESDELYLKIAKAKGHEIEVG